MFYNEPWNNASTGPVPFLDNPEVHLSCLTIVPSAKQTSGSVRLAGSIGNLGLMWLSFTSLLWLSLVR